MLVSNGWASHAIRRCCRRLGPIPVGRLIVWVRACRSSRLATAGRIARGRLSWHSNFCLPVATASGELSMEPLSLFFSSFSCLIDSKENENKCCTEWKVHVCCWCGGSFQNPKSIRRPYVKRLSCFCLCVLLLLSCVDWNVFFGGETRCWVLAVECLWLAHDLFIFDRFRPIICHFWCQTSGWQRRQGRPHVIS